MNIKDKKINLFMIQNTKRRDGLVNGKRKRLIYMREKCSLQTVILASNPPYGGQVLSHCRSAWERRQNLSSVANILNGFFKRKWIESLTLRNIHFRGQ